MEQFFQQLINGLAVGGIYALIALGYTMVYGVLKLINFAHGDLFTYGGYLGLTLLTSLLLNDRLAAVVSALGASIFLQNALMLVYGARVQVYPEGAVPQVMISLFGLEVPLLRILVVAASVVMMAALYLFVQKTKIGTAVRAAAIDQGAARLMGIDVNKVVSLVFLIGPA